MRRMSTSIPQISADRVAARKCRRARRRSSVQPALTQLENRTLLATMIWTNPAGGDWDIASNWVNSTVPGDQHVPTAADNAAIDLPDITITHDSGTDTVNSITSQDPIALNGGSLTVNAASTINNSLTVSFNSLTNSGATLGVNGSLAVNGMFTLGASTTLTGSGIVDAYDGLHLSSWYVSIQGATLNNHGAAIWDVDGGYDLLSGGAAINNLAGATFSARHLGRRLSGRRLVQQCRYVCGLNGRRQQRRYGVGPFQEYWYGRGSSGRARARRRQCNTQHRHVHRRRRNFADPARRSAVNIVRHLFEWARGPHQLHGRR